MTIRPVPLGTSVGRIPVVDVSPVAEAGRFPAKAVVGEAVPVRATVFREGHDAVAATAVLTDPSGVDRASARMVDIAPGLDRFEARVVPTSTGDWTFRVEGWSDPYGTWVHDATIKVEAGVDVELMLAEGALLLERAAARTGADAMSACGRPGAQGRGHRVCATSATPPRRASRRGCPARCTRPWRSTRCATW